MQNAEVKSEYRKDTLRFVLTGEIDHHSAPMLREKMDEAIFLYRPQRTVIVLGHLDFMDSSGLGLILGRMRKTEEMKVGFQLLNPPDSIRKILRLAGVENKVEIEYL